MAHTASESPVTIDAAPPPTPVESACEQLCGFRIRTNDAANFEILKKDIFEQRIYHFETTDPAPRILDCGGNIGMSVLYFKHVYPQARVIAFEPDPDIVPILAQNVERNCLRDVTIVEAAVADQAGVRTLYADGGYAGALAGNASTEARATGRPVEVACVRLRDYLDEPADFLKMNIEGAEWVVLNDCGDALRRVRAMVVEYHHLQGLPRTLHKILDLLDRQGFEYLINDFDSRTNPHVQPPFRLTERTSYYLLIYAQRRD